MKTLDKGCMDLRSISTALLCAVALSTGAVQAQSAPAAKGSEQLNQSMMSGMDGMKRMKMSGDVDMDFAMMMKMHHQQALKMAQVQLDSGKSPELKKMAAKMIKDQKKEIDQFDQWMKKNHGASTSHGHSHK